MVLLTKIKNLLAILNFSQLLTFIKSLFTTALVSTLFGIAGASLGKSFWAGFGYSAAAQFIIGYIVATITHSSYKNSTYLAELNYLEKLSTILNCAYCNHPNIVTFLPEEIPNIICEKCKNTSSIKLQFSVSRTTLPAGDPSMSILKEPQTTHKIKL